VLFERALCSDKIDGVISRKINDWRNEEEIQNGIKHPSPQAKDVATRKSATTNLAIQDHP